MGHKKATGRNEGANPGQIGSHPHYAKEGASEESLEESRGSTWAFLWCPNRAHQAKWERLLKWVPGLGWRMAVPQIDAIFIGILPQAALPLKFMV